MVLRKPLEASIEQLTDGRTVPVVLSYVHGDFIMLCNKRKHYRLVREEAHLCYTDRNTSETERPDRQPERRERQCLRSRLMRSVSYNRIVSGRNAKAEQAAVENSRRQHRETTGELQQTWDYSGMHEVRLFC